MTLTQGQQLNNRYTIVSLLGQGGFGAVYKAWDNTLDVACAIKESFILSPEGQRQFLREAQILAGLRHPNLPRVTDFFTIPEQGQYLVMDFVEGQDLEALRLQAGGRLPEAQALAWLSQVCDALSYLHRQKPPVIHRDIKPPNIRIAPPDDDYPQGRVMLVDFGIAKAFDPVMRTTIGARAVTPGFSPHEQYGQTAAVTDPRTDLYALGATLYALITGQVPPESVLRLLRDPLIPPHELNPAIAPQTETVILQALQNDPELRFQNAADFKTAITKALSTVSSRPPVDEQPVSPHSLTRLAMRHDAEAAYPPAPPPMEVLTAQPARPSPWKRIGLAIGLLAGLAVLAVLAGFFTKELSGSRLTQTSQAHANQTVLVLAGSFSATPTPSPFSPSLTPTPRPSSLAPSLTPTPSPPVPLTPLPGSTQISTVDEMILSYIPAGTFQMGGDADRGLAECHLLAEPFMDNICSRDAFTIEEPAHPVVLDSFWMDAYEVTNAQYARCVADGACSPPNNTGSYTHSIYYEDAAYSNYPVIFVGWDQAAAYCDWAGRELPTEAQWEYAARGGLAGALYPWGETFDGILGNFCDANCALGDEFNPNYADGYADTAPVGSYPANGYGLFDMAGNVWEWVADWYGQYSETVIENPSGTAPGEDRLVRGGSWNSFGDELRVSVRARVRPEMSGIGVGFRCVRLWKVENTAQLTPAPTHPLLSPSPVQATPTTTPVGPFKYTVQTGDTLATIAASFNSDIMTLLALNPAIDPQTQALSVGQAILIPAQGAALITQTSPLDGMVLAYIPGGTFKMGSASGDTNEQIVHTVTLDSFWMDQTEVTNDMYAQCVASEACSPPHETSTRTRSSYYDDAAYANYPVIYVDWNQASAYCAWVERQLPTEAQWEYAARGGLEGALYPWGNEAPSCTLGAQNGAQFIDCIPDDTIAVASFAPNGYGIFDMAGNVWEWVADWYSEDYYSSSPALNPSGPTSGDYRVIRGGNWGCLSYLIRVSQRFGSNPDGGGLRLGFRCAISP